MIYLRSLRKQNKSSSRKREKLISFGALAAFFALLPMALGLARGSEANTPLGRSVIGGLLAGLVTTPFMVPALYSLVLRDRPGARESEEEPELVRDEQRSGEPNSGGCEM